MHYKQLRLMKKSVRNAFSNTEFNISLTYRIIQIVAKIIQQTLRTIQGGGYEENSIKC